MVRRIGESAICRTAPTNSICSTVDEQDQQLGIQGRQESPPRGRRVSCH